MQIVCWTKETKFHRSFQDGWLIQEQRIHSWSQITMSTNKLKLKANQNIKESNFLLVQIMIIKCLIAVVWSILQNRQRITILVRSSILYYNERCTVCKTLVLICSEWCEGILAKFGRCFASSEICRIWKFLLAKLQKFVCSFLTP